MIVVVNKVLTQQTMTTLDIHDTEAEVWITEQLQQSEPLGATGEPGREPGTSSRSRSRSPLRSRGVGQLHVVLGDSIARRANFQSTDQGDEVFDRSRGGATWSSVLQNLQKDLDDRLAAAQAFGMDPGHCAIWLSGNDVYSRVTGLPNKGMSHLCDVGQVAKLVIAKAETLNDQVFVLGPLPRYCSDLVGSTWESTAAYHLERTLLKTSLGSGTHFVRLGRALTKKISHSRSGMSEGCLPWFAPDRLHLSPLGYQKLSTHMPAWLQVGTE